MTDHAEEWAVTEPPEIYIVKAGDYRAKIAAAFGVTVAALDAANTATKGYDSFTVGTAIVIPPPSEGASP